MTFACLVLHPKVNGARSFSPCPAAVSLEDAAQVLSSPAKASLEPGFALTTSSAASDA